MNMKNDIYFIHFKLIVRIFYIEIILFYFPFVSIIRFSLSPFPVKPADQRHYRPSLTPLTGRMMGTEGEGKKKKG